MSFCLGFKLGWDNVEKSLYGMCLSCKIRGYFYIRGSESLYIKKEDAFEFFSVMCLIQILEKVFDFKAFMWFFFN